MLRLMDFLLPPLVVPSNGKRLALILSSPKVSLIHASASGPASLPSSHTWRASHVQAMGLGSGFEFLVMVVAVVAYVLDAMHQIAEMRHLMQEVWLPARK